MALLMLVWLSTRVYAVCEVVPLHECLRNASRSDDSDSSVMQLHRPVRRWLKDPDTSAEDLASNVTELKQQLQILRSMRSFTLTDVGSRVNKVNDVEEVKERISSLLPSLIRTISPLTAAKLGIAIRSDDLEVLGGQELDFSLRRRVKKPKRKPVAKGLPWTKGLVPFCFDSNVPSNWKILVVEAMHEWQKAVACLDFQQVDADDVRGGCQVGHFGYRGIRILMSNGNFGFIGQPKSSFKQPELHIFENASILLYLGIVIHELGHSLGVSHEHQRKDRDDYVKVFTKRIREDELRFYEINEEVGRTFPYDILSIMHYASTHPTASLKKGAELIRAKDEACDFYMKLDASITCSQIKNAMGQRFGITQLQANRVAKHYQSENPLCKSSYDFEISPTAQLGNTHYPLRRWLPRSTAPFNTASRQEYSRYNFSMYGTGGCIEPNGDWSVWKGDTGGRLKFGSSGHLAFHPAVQQKPGKAVSWTSRTCGGRRRRRRSCDSGTSFCFQDDGNLVVYRGGRALWTTDTYGSRRADSIAVYDRHWSVLQEGYRNDNDFVYWYAYSLGSYPPEAPPSMEIHYFSGCVRDVVWQRPDLVGTRLQFLNGNLELVCQRKRRKGSDNLRSKKIWESGTNENLLDSSNHCLRWRRGGSGDGDLIIYRNYNSDLDRGEVLWRSSNHEQFGGSSKIVIFAAEWTLFDKDGLAIATFPPGTNHMTLDVDTL